MNEGVFRVLDALGHGRETARTELIRVSGEAHSVVTALTKDKAKWFDVAGESLRLSTKGLAALAREQHARRPALEPDALLEQLKALTRTRPRVKRELDQVFATLPSVVQRARFLVERGDVQRGLIFFGDDDLTALALNLLLDAAADEKKVTVLDIDQEILDFYADYPRIRTVHHDLREPLPRELHRKFGAVFTDPPYAPAGFALFLSRAAQVLKSDGRLYAQFGHSRRARERGLAKQRQVAEIGFLIEELLPDFTHYNGAESIGAVSALGVLSMTPQTKPLKEEELQGALYTRTPPEND